jgi:hypothetical protein
MGHSRRKRKRYRSEVTEATARSPGYCRGWARGAPVGARDLALIRKAIAQGWEVPRAVQQRAMSDLLQTLENTEDPYLVIRIARLCLWLDVRQGP